LDRLPFMKKSATKQSLTVLTTTFDVGVKTKSLKDWNALVIEKLANYLEEGADIVLFPELFALSVGSHLSKPGDKALLEFASHNYWEILVPRVQKVTSRSNCMVVLGTSPFKAADGYYNRSAIFLGDKIATQDKIYLTPWESAFKPGKKLQVFSFRGIKVAVLICLDIEVAQLSYLLHEAQIDLLLVPSATESILGVERVQRCASARAIELGAYVVTAPTVGKFTKSELLSENVGMLSLYLPSQSPFMRELRLQHSEIFESGFFEKSFDLNFKRVKDLSKLKTETAPRNLTHQALNKIELVQSI
jgi:predicted amidohydrolase